MLLISIPKPCHENWDEMSPREQGAFCDVCAKTVIDFTSLTDEEVKNYFFQNNDQKTCGRFKNEQLINPENPLPQLLTASLPFWKKFLAIVFILFGSFISGCKSRTIGKPLLNKSEVSVTKLNATLGLTLIEPVHDTIILSETCYSTKGLTETVIVEEPDSTRKIMLDENGNERNDRP